MCHVVTSYLRARSIPHNEPGVFCVLSQFRGRVLLPYALTVQDCKQETIFHSQYTRAGGHLNKSRAGYRNILSAFRGRGSILRCYYVEDNWSLRGEDSQSLPRLTMTRHVDDAGEGGSSTFAIFNQLGLSGLSAKSRGGSRVWGKGDISSFRNCLTSEKANTTGE
jgi:hypothetical protein